MYDWAHWAQLVMMSRVAVILFVGLSPIHVLSIRWYKFVHWMMCPRWEEMWITSRAEIITIYKISVHSTCPKLCGVTCSITHSLTPFLPLLPHPIHRWPCAKPYLYWMPFKLISCLPIVHIIHSPSEMERPEMCWIRDLRLSVCPSWEDRTYLRRYSEEEKEWMIWYLLHGKTNTEWQFYNITMIEEWWAEEEGEPLAEIMWWSYCW